MRKIKAVLILLIGFLAIGTFPSYAAIDMSIIQEVCNKQSQIKTLLKELTPSGRNATLAIQKDLQILSSAAYLIIFNKVKAQNMPSFNRVASADPNNMQLFVDLFIKAKPTDELIDACKAKQDEELLVSKFPIKNQDSVKYFQKHIHKKYAAALTHLSTIVQTVNSDLISDLMKNEKMTTLTSLAKLL